MAYFCFNAFEQIFYGFNHEGDLKPIDIPNCDFPCSLTEFGKSVEQIIIRDYDDTCTI